MACPQATTTAAKSREKDHGPLCGVWRGMPLLLWWLVDVISSCQKAPESNGKHSARTELGS